MRKVVTAKVVGAPAKGEKMRDMLIVICDDGSVWNFNWVDAYWESWPSVPGTPAAEQAEGG